MTEAKGETAKGAVEVIELSRQRQTAARRVAESRATIPHLYVTSGADFAGDPADLGPAIVKAAALALREHPDVNGTYRDGRLERHGRVNVGVAVAARDTVVYPTVFDADAKAREAIAEELAKLADRARGGEITQAELAGATFSISTLGGPRTRSVLATIVPGQAAILSVGQGREGSVELTLGCDERIVGADLAGTFLGRIGTLLEEPAAP